MGSTLTSIRDDTDNKLLQLKVQNRDIQAYVQHTVYVHDNDRVTYNQDVTEQNVQIVRYNRNVGILASRYTKQFSYNQ